MKRAFSAGLQLASIVQSLISADPIRLPDASVGVICDASIVKEEDLLQQIETKEINKMDDIFIVF